MQEDYEKANQDHHNQAEKDLLSFEKYINHAIDLSATYTALETLKEGVFEFSKYPALQRKINLLFKDFNAKTTQKIDFCVEKHYRKSASKPFIFNGENIPFQEVKKHLEAFKNRPERLLSERVWNLTSQVRTEIEMALDLAISDGVSAKNLATELKKHLKNPDALFRRYRDKNGHLQLSKKAQEYHSGRGVYRSAYKNAERLARTEINIAYRTADLDRWQSMEMVSGYEIKRSKHPFGCKICEMMKGKYPKTFLWVGNHPNCRCYMTPIFTKDIQKVPINENLVQWVSENQEKLNADKLPFFLQNNSKAVERILKEKKETWETIPTERGKVRVSSFHGKNERQENIEIASYFANKYSYEIDLLRKLENKKSADTLNKTLGIEQEYKQISKPTKSAIDNALRSAKDQADNIVLDIKTEISAGDLRDSITNRVNRSENIKTITILKNGNDKTYTRKEILNEGWTL